MISVFLITLTVESDMDIPDLTGIGFSDFFGSGD